MKHAILLALLVAAACSGSSPAPNPAAELRQSATALGSVKTVAADVKFGGGLVYQGFTLDSASSKWPSSASREARLLITSSTSG